MLYSDIEDLIFCPDACGHVCDGVYYTDPFFAKVGDVAADAFLFYLPHGDEPVAYGGIVIEPREQRVLKVLEDVELLLPSLTADRDGEEEYRCLYEKLHEFIFKDELSAKQREIASAYSAFVEKEGYEYLKNVYTELFPEVLEWLKNNS